MQVAQIQEDYALGVSTMSHPELPPRGAIIRVLGCGVCGSDLDKLVHKKNQPGQVLGHEVVGVIETLSDGHPEGWKVGDRLVTAHHVPSLCCHYCLNGSESMCCHFKGTNLTPGGFSELIGLTEGHLRHTAFHVPESVSSAEASCVEPLACVLRAVHRSEVGRNQEHKSTPSKNGLVVIVGLGFIGLLAAQLYQHRGYQIIGLDLEPDRLALAKEQGFVTHAFHPVEDAQALEISMAQCSPVARADIVFLTAVNCATVEQSLSLLRDGGNLLIFASATPNTSIDPSRLYFREINLITSYSPALADLRQASELIFTRRINVSPLITHTLPLAEIGQAFELYRSGQAVKVFVSMEGKP